MGGYNDRVPLFPKVPASLELLSLASPQGTWATENTDPASLKAEISRGSEMTESRPSRGCLGAETIESSRSQGTWAAELPESRVSQRYLGPKRLWGLE